MNHPVLKLHHIISSVSLAFIKVHWNCDPQKEFLSRPHLQSNSFSFSNPFHFSLELSEWNGFHYLQLVFDEPEGEKRNPRWSARSWISFDLIPTLSIRYTKETWTNLNQKLWIACTSIYTQNYQNGAIVMLACLLQLCNSSGSVATCG